MFRILIALLLGLLIFRLATVLFRGTDTAARKRAGERRGKRVGEGKIIKDEIDDDREKR